MAERPRTIHEAAAIVGVNIAGAIVILAGGYLLSRALLAVLLALGWPLPVTP